MSTPVPNTFSKDQDRESAGSALALVGERLPAGALLPSSAAFEPLEYEILHQVAGRVRLRVPALKDDGELSGRLVSYLSSLAGVESVRTNTWCASATINFDPDVLRAEVLLRHIRLPGSHPDAVSASGATILSRLSVLLRNIVRRLETSVPAVAQFVLGTLAFGATILGAPPAIALGLTVAATLPSIGRATATVLDDARLGVDGLDSIAATLMVIQGNFGAASFMTALIGLGEYIRELTARRCKKMITNLLGLAGRSAWVVSGDKRICVPAEEVKPGDTVVVYPGEMIPVDGAVLGGHGSVNQAGLTGESMPAEVSRGSQVFASTVLIDGKLYVRCEAVGADSRAGLIVDMVASAPLQETRMQNYAAKIADRLVGPILLSGVVCFALTRNLTRTMSMLIFDFSTGLRIAAPTAVLASMQKAGTRGILIKSGAALEKLAAVNAIVLDKTGTLTVGEPRITQVVALNGHPEGDVLSLAAAVEARLRHPAARAIVRHARESGIEVPERSESVHKMGMGASAVVGRDNVTVGSKRLLESVGIDVTLAEPVEKEILGRGESLAYVAINRQLAGVVAYSDQIRPEAAQVIARLKRRGVKKIVMATGDHEASANAVAGSLGIDSVLAGAFPEQKAELVKRLKERGYTVAVVGDGINDSPALVHADVGVSLHSGTDAAREHSEVVLTDDDLSRLPEAIDIARGAMELVGETIGLVLVPNGVGLALAASGAIGPAVSTLLNNGSAILAGVNSLRPLINTSWSKSECLAIDGDLDSD